MLRSRCNYFIYFHLIMQIRFVVFSLAVPDANFTINLYRALRQRNSVVKNAFHVHSAGGKLCVSFESFGFGNYLVHVNYVDFPFHVGLLLTILIFRHIPIYIHNLTFSVGITICFSNQFLFLSHTILHGKTRNPF